MNSSIYRFTLDMHSAQSQISIPVLLGDTGREWHINLSDGGKQYIIADGCLAMISVKRPTGTHFQEFCAIKDNTTIVYKFEQNTNTAAVEGIHDCDISIYGLDGAVITTARFTMVVYERAIPVNETLSDTDVTLYDAILKKEAERQAAETQRVENETARLEAGEVALKAAQEAQDAAERAEEIVTSIVTNTKTHIEGNGGTLDLEVEDGVIYEIVGYNIINISAPSGEDYTSHLFVFFANNGQDVGFQFPDEMKVYGANPSMVDGGDTWEVNVDNIGGALCMKKEVIT